MSFFLRHSWVTGVRLPSGTSLASCEQCGVLRSTNADGDVVWIRRAEREADRVLHLEPVCVEPKESRKWKADRAARVRERARREAVARYPDSDAHPYAVLPGFPENG